MKRANQAVVGNLTVIAGDTGLIWIAWIKPGTQHEFLMKLRCQWERNARLLLSVRQDHSSALQYLAMIQKNWSHGFHYKRSALAALRKVGLFEKSAKAPKRLLTRASCRARALQAA